jgi:hypothetical protein
MALARLQSQHVDLGFKAGGDGREVGGAGVGVKFEVADLGA